MKNASVIFIVIVIIALGGYILLKKGTFDYTASPADQTTEQTTSDEPIVTEEETEDTTPLAFERETVIGTSANGNDITAYHFGTGSTEIMFIGGIHGGYSFNTALVGFELIDYLKEHKDAIPENETITVIPVLNPDGLEAVVGTTGRFDGSTVTKNDEARVLGRFNGNEVDLNRNFDCEWTATATWQNRSVSGGDTQFSEPEAQAIEDYVTEHKPSAAIVYYSQAGGVYSSTCKNGILPETTALTNTYAKASEYPAYEKFDYYTITGDMVNWFAKEKIPAISVLLTNHEGTEWNKNQKGIDAVLQSYAQ